DSDSGTEVRNDLSAWEPKLKPGAAVLLHGLGLERDDPPAAAWNKWIGKTPRADFPDGLGLSVAAFGKSSPASFFVKHSEDIAVIYSMAAARIDAVARAAAAEKKTAAFETRQ